MFTDLKRGTKAFTLLELIVVIVILGILAAIAVPSFNAVVSRTHDASTRATLDSYLREVGALHALGTSWDESFLLAAEDTTYTGPAAPTANAPGLYAAGGGKLEVKKDYPMQPYGSQVGYQAGYSNNGVLSTTNNGGEEVVLAVLRSKSQKVCVGAVKNNGQILSTCGPSTASKPVTAVNVFSNSFDFLPPGLGGPLVYAGPGGSTPGDGTNSPGTSPNPSPSPTPTVAKEVPVAPATSSVKLVGKTVTVTWSPVTSTNEAPVLGYQIMRASGATKALAEENLAKQNKAYRAVNGENVTTLNDSLTTASWYCYSVATRGSAGNSTTTISGCVELTPAAAGVTKEIAGPLMNVARASFAYATDKNGYIYAAGGNTIEAQNTAELYDPTKKAWIPLPDLPEARSASAGVVDSQGNFYVIGNYHGGVNYKYDVVNKKGWVAIPALKTPRHSGAAVIDSQDRIYYIGGALVRSSPAVTTVERYDTKSSEGPWSSMANMTEPRETFSAVLTNDKIYALNGSATSGAPASSAGNKVQSYTPNADTGFWSSVTPLPGPSRSRTSAVVDRDNNVFVYGGTAYAGDLGDTQTLTGYNFVNGTNQTYTVTPKKLSSTGLSVNADRQLHVFGGATRVTFFIQY